MKKLYLFLLMLAVASGISVKAESLCLTLDFTNGTMAQFAIPEKPVVTMSGEELVVTTSENLTASYPLADVEKFRFADGVTAAIGSVSVDNGYVIERLDGTAIVLSGSSLTSAAVYNLSGVRVAEGVLNGSTISVDIANLLPGVYVVEIAGYPSMKIKK